MKKIISLIAVLFAVFSASAQEAAVKLSAQKFQQVALQAAASYDDAPIAITYLNDNELGGIGGISQSVKASMAVRFPAAAYRGTSIKYLRFNFCGAVTNVVCSLRTDLDNYSTVFSKEIGSVTGSQAHWVEVALDTPYVVAEDQEWIVVGYSCNMAASTYPLSIGGSNVVIPNSCYLDVADQGWEDYSGNGWIAAIEAYAFGEVAQNVASMQKLSNFSARLGEKAYCTVSVQNAAANTIDNLDVEYEFLGEKKSQTVNVSIPGMLSSAFQLELPATQERGIFPVSVKITKVNGEDNTSTENESSASLYVVPEDYKKMVVCEELTGNTCGYCPRGIVAMEYMRETYPDTFLPIAAHLYSTTDPMYTSTYKGLSNYCKGAPSCFIDRTYVDDPMYAEVYYNALIKAAPLAKISLEASVDPADSTNVTLKATTQFAFPEASDRYRIAFVVLEDNVDKSKTGSSLYQTNYYSGNAYGAMGGWEKLGSRVKTTFQDVARGIYNFDGISNSVPTSLEDGVDYTYEYKVNMPFVLNMANVRFAALLINANTGTIANATVISNTTSGVSNISADEMVKCWAVQGGIVVKNSANASEPMNVEIYSLSGALVASQDNVTDGSVVPVNSKGIYIVRCISGNTIADTKIAL